MQHAVTVRLALLFALFVLVACEPKSTTVDPPPADRDLVADPEPGDRDAGADPEPADVGADADQPGDPVTSDDDPEPSDGAGDASGDDDGDPAPFLTTWEYDFTVAGNGDALQSSDWLLDAGSVLEAEHGYYMNQATIAAPYLFTGDFTVEFEFYLKQIDTDEIYRHAFRLTGPVWATNSARRYVGFAHYYASVPEHQDAYYQIDQGNGSYSSTDIQGNAPGLAVNSVSTCTFAKLGQTVTIHLNGQQVREVQIATANLSAAGYAPMVHGHNSTDQADSNFYLRKIKVTYMSDERVDHDWTP